MNFRSGCEDRPDMERPKIQMLVDDGEEEELVELAAPSADAAIRLKLGDTSKNMAICKFETDIGNIKID